MVSTTSYWRTCLSRITALVGAIPRNIWCKHLPSRFAREIQLGRNMATTLVRKKRNHSVKTYEEKLEIIIFAEENPHLKQKAIAEKYGMKPQTLSDLLRNREAIKSKFSRQQNIQPTTIQVDPSCEESGIIVIETAPECTRKKRRLSTKSFQEKLEIIKFAEENPSLKQKAIAAKYDMKPQTLSDLLKNKETIKARATVSEHMQRSTRQRKITHEDVDKALILWYRELTSSSGSHIDGETLRLKACYFAREFARQSNRDISAEISSSWIERFKKRYGIGRVPQSGGIPKNLSGTCDTWFTVVLPSILHSFIPQDIYSFDETGLLWRLLPREEANQWGGKPPRGTAAEDRITLVGGANMDGSDKTHLLVIGRSKNPEPFRNAKWLPVKYVNNKYACLTKPIFMDYIRTLDYHFQMENRHVAVILNTNPAHAADSINGLTNITVFYLPVDARFHMQPMKAGIFRDMKFSYRLRLCKRQLACLEENSAFKYDLLDAMMTLSASWNDVSPEVIRTGFNLSGIALSDDPHESENNSIEARRDFYECGVIWNRIADINRMKGMTSFEDFIEIDQDLQTVQSLSEQDIIDIVHDDKNPNDHEIHSCKDEIIILDADLIDNDGSRSELSEMRPPPSATDALGALDILRRFWISRRSLDDLGFDLQDIEDAILSEGLYGQINQTHV